VARDDGVEAEVLSSLRALAADPQTPDIVRRAARESLKRLES